MTRPCDAERHYHDVTRLSVLAVGESVVADCQCGGGALRATRTAAGCEVSVPGGEVVWSSLGPLELTDGTEVTVGVAQGLSEG